MPGIRKLHGVQAIVRPDRRNEYLDCWKVYAGEAEAAGARVWLFEDEVLPGRFFEFTEYRARKGMVASLRRAVQEAGLSQRCVRREGDDLIYREVDAGNR